MTTETFMPAPGKNYQGPMMPQFILTKEITFGAKVMYAILCDCAAYYKADSCYPSHATLAKKLSCSVSSVKRYLAELTSEKLISIELREQTSNIYYMLRPDTLMADGTVAPDKMEAVRQSQVVACESETAPHQSKVGHPRFKVNHAQPKVGDIDNLNKKPEEKTNPPLPPVTVPRSTSPAPRPVVGGGSFFADFEKLWEAYPRKDAKVPAEQAYKQLLRNKRCPSLLELLAAVKRFMLTAIWQKDNGRFIPYLSNFLKNRRWLDPLSDEEAEANRKRLEAEQRELARKQAEEAEKARSREQRERLRPIFYAFVERFGEEARRINERLDARNFGSWMFYYGKYHGPIAADVPDGTTQDIYAFMQAYQRQREADTYRAAQQVIQRAAVTAHTSHSNNRERKPVLCADILHSDNFMARFLPAPQPLCAAV